MDFIVYGIIAVVVLLAAGELYLKAKHETLSQLLAVLEGKSATPPVTVVVSPSPPTPPPVAAPVPAPASPIVSAPAPTSSAPDANGSVLLTGINYPSLAVLRWLCMGTLPSVTPGGLAYATIVWNCASAKLEETMGGNIAIGRAMVAQTNPLTGSPTYAPATGAAANISPAVYVVPAEHATIADAVAYVNACGAKAAATPPAPGPSPLA